MLEAAVARTGQTLLGWRDVPTDNSEIGNSAKAVEPVFRQIFVGRDSIGKEPRRTRAQAVPDSETRGKRGGELRTFTDKNYFYLSSLSANTIVYKGMLSADQMDTYFPDLVDPRVESALAVVHQRFSTNTFPSWSLAHPFRYISHNGEINTLRGNINWMKARERQFESAFYGEDVKDLLPDTQRSRQRFRHLRQRPGNAGHVRPFASARHDDAHSGSLGRTQDDVRREEGILRIPLVPDGTVGRSGLDGLHRRPRPSVRFSTAMACVRRATTF